MSANDPIILHLVAADITLGRLRTLQTLRQTGTAGCEHKVICVGPLDERLRRLPLGAHVRAPLAGGWLRGRALSRAVAALNTGNGRAVALHAWSPTALTWAATLADRRWPLAIEAEAGTTLHLLLRELERRPPTGTHVIVCASELAAQRLRSAGRSARTCLVIPETADPVEIDVARRQRLRSSLGVRPDQKLLLVLPPFDRGSGTFTAAWAAMLLEKPRPDVRLCVVGAGYEWRRAQRLAHCGRHEHVVIFRDDCADSAELPAAADLAVCLPPGDAPLTALVWAMAAGCPIVASDVPAVRELLEDGVSAWLCPPDDPLAAARTMLTALESGTATRRRAEAARRRLETLGSISGVIAAYARLHTRLTAGTSGSS
jgi:glycosyltransferase involved in cell wall biosynthesis